MSEQALDQSSSSSGLTGREWLSAYLFWEADDTMGVWGHAGSAGIYGATADRVVLEVVEPIVVECRERGWAESFFFVRYSEDGPHVRLRLLHTSKESEQSLRRLVAARAQEAIAADAQGEGLLTKFEWVPYEPEYERYGGPQGMDLSEEIFHDSSLAAIDLLRKIDRSSRSGRLGKGLLAMLVMLHAFLESRDSCAELAGQYGSNYLRALVPDPELQETWQKRFEEGFDRQSDRLAPYVEAAWEALASGQELTPELDSYKATLDLSRRRFRDLFDQGVLVYGGETLTDWRRAVGSIMPSYVHMMNNRMGISIQEESYLSVLIQHTLAAGSDPAPSSAQGSRG